MVLIYIFIYLIFLILLYVFIIKRLKILCARHSDNTWIPSLAKGYRIIRRRMVLILIILFFLGSLILLTFSQKDIIYKTWLYNDKQLENDKIIDNSIPPSLW